jgi:hypothetical protein
LIIVTFTASEWPGEPTQSAEFLALTNVGKAITSRDLESVLCSTNEAKFQAEKIRLLGLDTLIQNTSKPWIFEDSTKETIIFGKHLLNLLSRPPLDTTNELHLQRSNYVQLFQPLLQYFRAISSWWAVAQGISHEALSDGLSAEEYLPDRINATDEGFRLDEVGTVIPTDWVLNPIDIRVNVLVFGRLPHHTMTAVHQCLSTEKFTQPLPSNSTIHVIIRPSHDEIILTHDRMGTGEDDTGSSNLFMFSISAEGCTCTQDPSVWRARKLNRLRKPHTNLEYVDLGYRLRSHANLTVLRVPLTYLRIMPQRLGRLKWKTRQELPLAGCNQSLASSSGFRRVRQLNPTSLNHQSPSQFQIVHSYPLSIQRDLEMPVCHSGH